MVFLVMNLQQQKERLYETARRRTQHSLRALVPVGMENTQLVQQQALLNKEKTGRSSRRAVISNSLPLQHKIDDKYTRCERIQDRKQCI